MLPQVVYIPDGNWIIVAVDPLLFTIMCLKEPAYQVQTKPPIFHLPIGPACEAYSDSVTLPPFYFRESRYELTAQTDGLLTLHDVDVFTLWKPMDIFNETELPALSDLPELDDIQDVPIDTLVRNLNNLHRPEHLASPSRLVKVWECLKYILTLLMVLSMTLLILWLKFRKEKFGLHSCICAMRNCKIMRKTGTDQTAGQMDVANVKSTGSAQNQPMEVVKVPETVGCTPNSGTLVLELASSVP